MHNVGSALFVSLRHELMARMCNVALTSIVSHMHSLLHSLLHGFECPGDQAVAVIDDGWSQSYQVVQYALMLMLL